MSVLLISSNSLLREVVGATLAEAGIGLVNAEPSRSAAAVRNANPRVIIVDSAAESAALAGLVDCARSLSCCRLILVHSSRNDLVLLDLRYRSMRQGADLVEAVREGLAAGTPPPVRME